MRMTNINVFLDGYKKKTLIFLLRENKEGKKEVLLGYHDKQEKLNAPGGKVGDLEEFKGETSTEAAIRELREETGVEAQEIKKNGNIIFDFPNKETIDLDIFVVTKWKGEPSETEDHKFRDPKWYTVDNLPWKEMWASDKYWFPLALGDTPFEGELTFAQSGDVLKMDITSTALEESKENKEIQTV